MNAEMTPIDWAKRPLQKYADFTGRAPRAEYWWFVLATAIIFVVLSIVESLLGLNRMFLGVYGPLTMLLWVAVLLPSLSVGVRRLSDSNRSGWWLLLLVPYLVGAILMRAVMAAGGAGVGTAGIFMLIGAVCAIVLLVFYCLPGTAGDNSYGADPYGAVGPAVAAD